MTKSTERRWHSLTASDVASILNTGEHGVSREEAVERLERVGPNKLQEASGPSWIQLLLHQFQSPLIYLLVIATVVTVFLQEFIDAGVIAAVLLLNAVIGFVQERRAEDSVRALMKLVSPQAR